MTVACSSSMPISRRASALGGWALKNLKVRHVAWGVLAFFICWGVFVNRSGIGDYWLGRGWDFQLTGQLGDSFGVVSAVMTSLAAVFTYQTLVNTQKLAADEKFDSEKRERDRISSDSRRDAEATYFKLLEARAQVLGDIELGGISGNQATEKLVEWIRDYNKYNTPNKSDEELYNETYSQKRNDLGHYFRFTYHIVLHVSENLKSNSYNHLRILRAKMSNSELVLLALNCAYGEGRKKFKPMVERYALLHNIDPADRQRFDLDSYFKTRAFGLPRRSQSKKARP